MENQNPPELPLEEKKPYTPPELVEYGDLYDLTRIGTGAVQDVDGASVAA